jgi:hypothetical protein
MTELRLHSFVDFMELLCADTVHHSVSAEPASVAAKITGRSADEIQIPNRKYWSV